ncbi:MAG: MFS transporter [Candidatus Saccharimonadales bacterium]
MTPEYKQQLEKNIGKYSWYKIFTKRVYLPLITIQLVSAGKVTIGQLAVISVISAIVQLVLQLPTGYFADRYGNRAAIVTGSWIAVTSPLLYVFMPNFVGGTIASVLFFGGWAFQSGAIEAFIHDTLVSLDREQQYAKVMGRAQSYGLIGNVVLLALIPATYSINHALPFILGFVSMLVMLYLAYSFSYPPRDMTIKVRNPFAAARSIVNRQNIALFVFAGAMAGVSYRGGDYRELVWRHAGIAITLFGILVALSSLVGAAMGRYLHTLDKLKPTTFYLFDLLYLSGFLLLVGLWNNPFSVVLAFTMLAAYDRVRMIVFQAKLLHDRQHAYKASLISALNLFGTIGQTVAITVLAANVTHHGYQGGYVRFAISVLAVGFILWLIVVISVSSRTITLSES